MIPKPGKMYQMNTKCTEWSENIPNVCKISQMSVKYSKWPKNMSTCSNLRPSKIYPNWDFWFEKKPSGNPVPHPFVATVPPIAFIPWTRCLWPEKSTKTSGHSRFERAVPDFCYKRSVRSGSGISCLNTQQPVNLLFI
jgi:hypothetical protein